MFGIGREIWKARCLRQSNAMSTYRVRGQFGLKTETSFNDGKIIASCRFEYLLKHNVDRVVASVNSIEQKKMFRFVFFPSFTRISRLLRLHSDYFEPYRSTGFHPQSQEAYDAAAGGLIRPPSSQVPFTYNIKCVSFDLPYFDLG